MSICFIGDIDYKLTDATNENTPTEFGCSRSEYIHYDVYSNNIEKIQSGIQKYKEKLLAIGVNPKDMSSDLLNDMSVEEVQSRWHLNEDVASKAYDILYAYCMGLDILEAVEENGECHFYLPA